MSTTLAAVGRCLVIHNVWKNGDVLPTSMLPSQSAHYLRFWQLFGTFYQIYEPRRQDPRDKLFARLSLFKRTHPKLLLPDYAQTTEEIVTNIFQCLLHQKTTSALSSAIGVEQPNDLPSWVVDWRSPSDRNDLLNKLPECRKWHAGFAKQQRRVIAAFDRPGGLRLHGKGLYCVTTLQHADSSSRGDTVQSIRSLHARREITHCISEL